MSTIIPAENADKMPTSFQPTERPRSLFALENADRTPLGPWNGPSQMFTGGRSIRLVLYGRISAEDVHSIWIDHKSTLGADLGPYTRWAEANPKSLIGNTIHALYAVVKDDRRYIVGVVRASLSDYPVAIFESPSDPSRTITQAIIASRPELKGQITGLLEGQSGKHTDLLMDQDFKSVVIINTSDDPPKPFVSELSSGSIPPLLRLPFAYCENLMKQAYDLEVFALQIIHILRAILHIIISLAKKTEAAFEDDSSDVEIALLAQDEVSEWLRATPMLARSLQEILDRVEELMGTVTTAYPGTLQKEIGKVFKAVCGDYPGAMDVRHSHRLFTKLGLIDCEEIGVPIHGSGTSETGLKPPRWTHYPAYPPPVGAPPYSVLRYNETSPKPKASPPPRWGSNSHQPLQQPTLDVSLFADVRLAALTLSSSTSAPSTPNSHHMSLGWVGPSLNKPLPPIPTSTGSANSDVDNKVANWRSGPASTLEASAYQTPSKWRTGYSSMSTIPQPPLLMPGPSGSPPAMQPNINTGEEAGARINQVQCPYCALKFDRPGRFQAHLDAAHSDVRPRFSSPTLTSPSSNIGFTSTGKKIFYSARGGARSDGVDITARTNVFSPKPTVLENPLPRHTVNHYLRRGTGNEWDDVVEDGVFERVLAHEQQRVQEMRRHEADHRDSWMELPGRARILKKKNPVAKKELESHPKGAAKNHTLGVWGGDTPITVPSSTPNDKPDA